MSTRLPRATIREAVNEGVVLLIAERATDDDCGPEQATRECIRALVDEAEKYGGWFGSITTRDEYDGPYRIVAFGYLHTDNRREAE